MITGSQLSQWYRSKAQKGWSPHSVCLCSSPISQPSSPGRCLHGLFSVHVYHLGIYPNSAMGGSSRRWEHKWREWRYTVCVHFCFWASILEESVLSHDYGVISDGVHPCIALLLSFYNFCRLAAAACWLGAHVISYRAFGPLISCLGQFCLLIVSMHVPACTYVIALPQVPIFFPHSYFFGPLILPQWPINPLFKH